MFGLIANLGCWSGIVVGSVPSLILTVCWRSSFRCPIAVVVCVPVSPENDLVYPADGMRRLLAMEKTSGIWTQKMLMRLERKMVNIMDHENKEVVERFPAHFVREPTAFTSNDPKVRLGRVSRGRKVRLREIVFLAAVL